MSAKNRDNKKPMEKHHSRIRVSPEENERINKAVALSGCPNRNTVTAAV